MPLFAWSCPPPTPLAAVFAARHHRLFRASTFSATVRGARPRGLTRGARPYYLIRGPPLVRSRPCRARSLAGAAAARALVRRGSATKGRRADRSRSWWAEPRPEDTGSPSGFWRCQVKLVPCSKVLRACSACCRCCRAGVSGRCELAERLELTPRALRRDIERLRSLGYPVGAASAVAGVISQQALPCHPFSWRTMKCSRGASRCGPRPVAPSPVL